ncbi:hypothetical protein EZS27_002667 [termite gut metagenome]|uniref:HMA domain-containing protein n=1 Tax=termite gut metagenome TaxID=433724 RepID=A0A5J4SUQ7_9ZZZZ
MKKYCFILVAGMFSLAACNVGNSKSKSSDAPKMETADASQSEHATLGVQGNCEMCKAHIEKAAKGVEGVSSALWNKEKKALHLHFNPKQTNLDAISNAIAKAGYDTDKDTADEKTYNALPDCCKYR